jgi:hypothetical protein
MRAHQPGSTPIDIPETVPNPAYTPAPAPERAPTKVPEKVPEKVISGIAEVTATSNGGLNPKLLISGSPFDRFEIGGQDSRLAEAAIQRLLAPPADHFCLANGGSKTQGLRARKSDRIWCISASSARSRRVPWQFDESLRAIDTRNSEDDSRAEEIKWVDEACDAPPWIRRERYRTLCHQ